MEHEKKIIVLMSGGIDSFLVAKLLKSDGFEIYPLFIDYNQLANAMEFTHVQKQVKFLELDNLSKISIDGLSDIITNSLTSNKSKNEFFPGRNLLLLTIAGQIAASKDISRIAIGIIDSVRIFPDCTQDFLTRSSNTISQAIGSKVVIYSPILDYNKLEVLIMAKEMKLPYQLSYSCQKGNLEECKKCPSCKELNMALRELI